MLMQVTGYHNSTRIPGNIAQEGISPINKIHSEHVSCTKNIPMNLYIEPMNNNDTLIQVSQKDRKVMLGMFLQYVKVFNPRCYSYRLVHIAPTRKKRPDMCIIILTGCSEQLKY